MANNVAWAVVVDEQNFILPSTVKWYRRDSIAAYVELYAPMSVPDWKQKPVQWRWCWLRRRHGCSARKIKMTVIGD